MNGRQPYPGLRPFEPEEPDIFFGREEQTDELLRRLGYTRFLAVTGPSGCGKSSLVRAGMMAALKAGFMAAAGWRWRMALMRPGWNPMAHLAASLLEALSLASTERARPETRAFFGATLRRGPLGLVELLRERPLPERTNLLLVVDQFEEIFRFQQEKELSAREARSEEHTSELQSR